MSSIWPILVLVCLWESLKAAGFPTPLDVETSRLEARIHILAAANREAASAGPSWPEASDAMRVPWNLSAEERCRMLSVPAPTHGPIAVLITGQLRTADLALQYLVHNVLEPSDPVDVFASVWANSTGTTTTTTTTSNRF